MAESKAAWGIDIGQSGLKALKVRYAEGTDQVIAEAFDYIPFPKILSQPDAVPEEIVPQAMQTFLSRNDLKGDLVAISVPGQSALARFIQLPPVESSKLGEIVKYEARQQIPFALEEVIWDFQPLGAGAEEGGFLLDAEVGLFAMKKDQVHQQLRPYNNAKVEVELIQIAPLALYNVLSFDELGIRRDSTGEPGDEYYIILDLGCDNTTLLVSNGYKIWIRNVPIGGNHFTRALTKEMKLSFAKAEHLKCNATKSPDPRAVFQALRPVFNDYVSEIQRSIGYFSSVNRSAKIVKVVGLGNGFKLAGLQKFLQQNLQYDVERPDTFRSLAGDAVLNSPMFSENILSFAVPYGLSLQALGLSRIRTTLLPPEIAMARKIRKKKPWAVAAAASLLGLFALSTIGNAKSYGVVHAPAFKTAEEAADKFKGTITSLDNAYQSEVSKFNATQQKLDGLTLNRRDSHWLEIFNAVVDSIPRSEDVDLLAPEGAQDDLISVTSITSERMSNLSTWYQGLADKTKIWLAEADKTAGPSGEGYLISVKGEHWRRDPSSGGVAGDPVQYIGQSFVANLQKPQAQRDGFPSRDVTRLGISHATLVDTAVPVQVQVPLTRTLTEIEMITGAGNQQNSPGQPVNPQSNQDFVTLLKTEFVVQFALKYVPPEQRPEIQAIPAEGTAPPANSATTPPAAPANPTAPQ